MLADGQPGITTPLTPPAAPAASGLADKLPAPGAAPQVVTPPSADPAAADWRASLSPELKGFVEKKNFKDMSSLVDSYQNYEKLMGVPKERLLRLPEKADDPAWNEVYTKLGRPEKAEEYQIASPEGGSKDFAEWAGKTFLEANLSRTQANQILGKWSEFQKQALETQQTEATQRVDAAKASLKKDWGMAFEQNVNVANKAAAEFGLDQKMMDKLAGALGIEGSMKLLHQIGSRVGEASFVTGDGGKPGFGGIRTPEVAQARIKELMKDNDFVRRYATGETAARDEMNRLHQQAYPSET